MASGSSEPIVVAIDGPSGVGKSVVAERLAQALGFHYAPSGAMYRAVGWLVESQAVPLRDEDRIAALVTGTPIDIAFRPGRSTVRVNGRDISAALAGEAVGRAASTVATLPVVRQSVTAQLRRLRWQGNLVMEGRDIGTVVFPDADVKFFLDASLDVRARRRWREMCQAGHGTRSRRSGRPSPYAMNRTAPVPLRHWCRRPTHTLSIRRISLLTMSCGLWYQRRNTTFCGVTVEPARLGLECGKVMSSQRCEP